MPTFAINTPTITSHPHIAYFNSFAYALEFLYADPYHDSQTRSFQLPKSSQENLCILEIRLHIYKTSVLGLKCLHIFSFGKENEHAFFIINQKWNEMQSVKVFHDTNLNHHQLVFGFKKCLLFISFHIPHQNVWEDSHQSIRLHMVQSNISQDLTPLHCCEDSADRTNHDKVIIDEGNNDKKFNDRGGMNDEGEQQAGAQYCTNEKTSKQEIHTTNVGLSHSSENKTTSTNSTTNNTHVASQSRLSHGHIGQDAIPPSVVTLNGHDNFPSCNWNVFMCDYGEISCFSFLSKESKHCIVGTDNGYLIVLDLKGVFFGPKVMHISQITFLELEEQRKLSIGLKSIIYNHKLGIFMASLLSTDDIVIFKVSTSKYDKEEYEFSKIHCISGSIFSISQRSHLFAVGMKTGDVILYEFAFSGCNKDGEQDLSIRKRCMLSLKDRGYLGNFPTVIHEAPYALEFSKNGNTIAVSYGTSGVAIFDQSGVCLMNMSELSTYSIGSNMLNIHTFHWDDGNCKLFCSQENDTIIYDIVKSVQATKMEENFQNAVVLQGGDRLLLFRLTTGGYHKLQWEHLLLQHEYLSKNNPIRHVITSRDGNNILVFGQHGCTVYNEVQRKWRIFGNESEEKSISCSTATWINDDILCLVDWNKRSSTSTLHLYPRFHLDNYSLLGKQKVCDKKIIHSSFSNGLLLFYDVDNHIHAFEITIRVVSSDPKETTYKCQIAYQTSKSLKEFMSHSLIPRAMVTLNCVTASNESLGGRCCLFLHQNRQLTVLYLDIMQEFLLEENVDNFWLENETEKELIFFIYSRENGLSLIIQDISFLSQPNCSKCSIYFKNLVGFDPGKCPLGILQEYGTFVHASMLIDNISGPDVYTVQPYTYPYAHVIILYRLICQQNPTKATEYASQFMEKSTYEAILEWLIFYVLSNESIAIEYNNTRHKINLVNHLELVVNFVKQFHSQFYLCILQCLRKVDIELGTKLLRVSKLDPRDIIQACTSRYLISSAVNMLIIVQREHGLEAALTTAYSLIQPLLQSANYQLLYDLSSYIIKLEYEISLDKGSASLNLISESASSDTTELKDNISRNPDKSYRLESTMKQHDYVSSSSIVQNDEATDVHDLTTNDESVPSQSVEYTTKANPSEGYNFIQNNEKFKSVLFTHCQGLLQSGNLPELLQAWSNLNLPLKRWLDELYNNDTFTNIHLEWEEYFSRLHQCFNLPRGSMISDSFAFSNYDYITSFENYMYFTTTQDTLYSIIEVQEEISCFFQLFDEARWCQWSILLAIILCDVEYIVDTLLKHKILWPSFVQLLNQTQNRGYKRLLDFVDRMLSYPDGGPQSPKS